MTTHLEAIQALKLQHWEVGSGNMAGRCATDGSLWPCQVGQEVYDLDDVAMPQIFTDAAEILSGPRTEDYGDPRDTHERIAAMWSVIFGTEISAHQVALAMVALKLARLIASGKQDSYTDMAGYLAIAESLHE